MNGHEQSAFQRALTDAVLEEYGDGAVSVCAVPKASKRGVGNVYRRLRVAVLAAVLMAMVVGTVLASSDISGIRYPAEEAKNAHYENKSTEKNMTPKWENEEVYSPLDIPFRFKMGDPLLKEDIINIHWYAEDNDDEIVFTQAPLANSFYDDPETEDNFPEEIRWEKRMINGFEVIIFYKDWITEYWWNDGEYMFILVFRWPDATEEDRYNIFESISVVENMREMIEKTIECTI